MAFRCALERGNERDRSRFMASSLRPSERPLFCFGKSELLPFSPFPFLFWYHSRHWKFQNKLSLTDRHGHPYAGGVFTHRWVGLVRAPLLGPRNRFGRKGSYGGAVFFSKSFQTRERRKEKNMVETRGSSGAARRERKWPLHLLSERGEDFFVACAITAQCERA